MTNRALAASTLLAWSIALPAAAQAPPKTHALLVGHGHSLSASVDDQRVLAAAPDAAKLGDERARDIREVHGRELHAEPADSSGRIAERSGPGPRHIG